MGVSLVPADISIKVLLILLACFVSPVFLLSLTAKAEISKSSITSCKNKPPLFSEFDNLTILKQKLNRSFRSLKNYISGNSCPVVKQKQPIKSPNIDTLGTSKLLPNQAASDVGVLSVITKDKADEMFNLLKNDCRIPFEFDVEGCYPRAHAMAKILEENGVITAKAFLHGSILEFPTKSGHFLKQLVV